MRIRDELGELFSDADFAGLYPSRGEADVVARQAGVDFGHAVRRGPLGSAGRAAVRGRLDWKYLLGLEPADLGFDHSVLTEFRDRLIVGKPLRSPATT
jgi:hypothetical protein